MANPLQRLHDLDQSVWLDHVSRGLLDAGELARLVRDGEVWGVTANPTIFEKAIAGSRDYDDRLRELVVAGKTGSEVYESLVERDIQEAADILRPVYERIGGGDGYVSIEVSMRKAIALLPNSAVLRPSLPFLASTSAIPGMVESSLRD